MKAIILSAGKSTRMKSKTAKFLHKICGKQVLAHVIESCLDAEIKELIAVIGNQGGEVRYMCESAGYPVEFVWQREMLGTGHAVMAAREHIKPDDTVLILFGDMPLITADAIKSIAAFYEQEKSNKTVAVISAAVPPDPFGYGRVFTDAEGNFQAIIEQKDLVTDEQHANPRVNTGVMLCSGEALLYGLDRIDNRNNKNEYYITDVPGVLTRDGFRVAVLDCADYKEFSGINTQAQLAEAEAIMRERINNAHMSNGVKIIDPQTVYIDCAVKIAADVTLYPGVILEGRTVIEEDAVIGAQTHIINSRIGAGAFIRNSVLESAVVGAQTRVGPFAYLRPGAVIGEHCRIGDFVEIKNAVIGDHTNASHLAYIGDAEIGSRVNFGCGAITVNYDGANKYKTIIEDGVFIGSNVNLIAPVTVHENAFAAAGSTITADIPENTLAIARQRQTNKSGWRRKLKNNTETPSSP